MMDESEKDREERVVRLWTTLAATPDGHLDIRSFKKGLKRIDHPLKYADPLLQNLVDEVSAGGNGQIQFDEFKRFVQHAENELHQLFVSIDKDGNGHISEDELKTAFARAGVTISNEKLSGFFEQVDTNHDGVISFQEWRDFLLFMPSSRNLRSILSYYSATGTLDPEGDVHINRSRGAGTTLLSFLQQPVLALSSFLSFYPLVFFQPSLEMSDWPEHTPEEISFPLNVEGDLEWLSLPWVVSAFVYYRYCEQTLTGSLPHLGYFIAGGIAGAVSRTCTAPLDRMKVYLIAQTGATVADVSAQQTRSAMSRLLRPFVEATKDLWRAGGLRSLFAGNGLNVVKIMPESSIKFGAYEAAKRFLARVEGHGDPKKLFASSQFLAGGTGGIVAQCFVYPLDTLKFRMQCETVQGGLHGARLIAATARSMWASGGVSAYYRGLPLGLVGMFPYAATDLFTFEYLKRTLSRRQAAATRVHEDDVALSNFTTGAIGAFSGALGASAVYPLNVLRTRLQAQGTVLHSPTYTGIADVARRTVRAEGLRGVYRGLSPTLMKVVPSVSISYVVYENSKRMLDLP